MTENTNEFHYHVVMETIDSSGDVISALGPYTVRDRDKAEKMAITYDEYISAWLIATQPDYDGDEYGEEIVYVEEGGEEDGMIVLEYQLDTNKGKIERIRVTACNGNVLTPEEQDKRLAQQMSEEMGFPVTPTRHPVTGERGFTIDMPEVLAEILAEVGIGEVINLPSKTPIFH